MRQTYMLQIPSYLVQVFKSPEWLIITTTRTLKDVDTEHSSQELSPLIVLLWSLFVIPFEVEAFLLFRVEQDVCDLLPGFFCRISAW